MIRFFNLFFILINSSNKNITFQSEKQETTYSTFFSDKLF